MGTLFDYRFRFKSEDIAQSKKLMIQANIKINENLLGKMNDKKETPMHCIGVSKVRNIITILSTS
tara:strand:+ start:2538 stop:2732 length:195 start_codon:yes stop_codon:yes gene_type:complete